jgi:hypothetical protein
MAKKSTDPDTSGSGHLGIRSGARSNGRSPASSTIRRTVHVSKGLDAPLDPETAARMLVLQMGIDSAIRWTEQVLRVLRGDDEQPRVLRRIK